MPRRVVKGKKDWAYKIAASDKGSYYAICIVSYPVYYHSYPAARISASIIALGSFCFTGISGSCVIPSLAHSASPLLFVPVTFSPFPFL